MKELYIEEIIRGNNSKQMSCQVQIDALRTDYRSIYTDEGDVMKYYNERYKMDIIHNMFVTNLNRWFEAKHTFQHHRKSAKEISHRKFITQMEVIDKKRRHLYEMFLIVFADFNMRLDAASKYPNTKKNIFLKMPNCTVRYIYDSRTRYYFKKDYFVNRKGTSRIRFAVDNIPEGIDYSKRFRMTLAVAKILFKMDRLIGKVDKPPLTVEQMIYDIVYHPSSNQFIRTVTAMHSKSFAKMLLHEDVARFICYALSLKKEDDKTAYSYPHLVGIFVSLIERSLPEVIGDEQLYEIHDIGGDEGRKKFLELYADETYIRSCMSDNPNGCMKFYSMNSDKCKMFTASDPNGHPIHRAILWHLGEARYYDRIYIPSENKSYPNKGFLDVDASYNKAINHLISLGYKSIKSQYVHDTFKWDREHMPYMDNMRYGSEWRGEMEMSNREDGDHEYCFENTNGYPEERDTYTCDVCGNRMSEDDRYYIEDRDMEACCDCSSYDEFCERSILSNDAVMCNYTHQTGHENDMHPYRTPRGIQGYVHNSVVEDGDVVWSDVNDAFIDASQAVELMDTDSDYEYLDDAHCCPLAEGDYEEDFDLPSCDNHSCSGYISEYIKIGDLLENQPSCACNRCDAYIEHLNELSCELIESED